MKNLKYTKNVGLLLISTASLIFVSCSSKPLKVVSEPEQAEVFIVDNDSNVEKSIGMTPLVKTKKELVEQLKGQSAPGALVNVRIKKDGFKTKDVWLPLNAGGSLGAQLKLKLDATRSSSDEMKTAGDIMDKVFLAQKYANNKQLERAIIEIDKVLEQFPKFDRAMTMKAAILYGQGSLKDSLKWYEDALDVNPEIQSALEMSGKIRKSLRLPARRNSGRLPASSKKAKVSL